MKKALLASAVIVGLGVAAHAQMPPGLGTPLFAAVLDSLGHVLSSEINFGTTTGTVYDGGLGATASSNASTALSNSSQASSAVSIAQTTANAACPTAGCTMTGAITTNAGLIDPPLDVALTGAAYSPPATGKDLIVFTQTSVLAAQTITLPACSSANAGRRYSFTSAGAITALTFSPLVTGWTNGSAAAIGGPIGVVCDGTLAAFVRVP